MKEILIVGDGFSAGIFTMHLLQAGFDPSQISVSGPGHLGHGNAFGCKDKDFRLNVRAQIMWIKSEERDEFLKWADKEIDDPEAIRPSGNFYRRSDFARFVNQKFLSTAGFDKVQHFKSKVKKIIRIKNKLTKQISWKAELENQKVLNAYNVVLAIGNPKPEWPCPLDDTIYKSRINLKSHLIENPWTGDWINNVNKEKSVLFIGSGLTTLDGLTALSGRKYKGQIHVVSSLGKFPPVQADWEKGTPNIWPKLKKERLSASKFIKIYRSHLPNLPPSEPSWQGAWEELRTDLSLNWQSLKQLDRKKLKERIGSLWSHFRFRSAPQGIDAVNKFLESKQLFFHKDRVIKLGFENGKVKALLSSGKKLWANSIINCSGSGKDKLINQIISDRLADPDCFGISLAVNTNHEVLNSSCESRDNQGLYMIGPNTNASLGDVVAASEVSMQALRLTKRLKSILNK